MTLVYGLHHKDIGQFNDTRYIVTMLARTCDKLERDRLLLFLNKVRLLVICFAFSEKFLMITFQ